MKKALRLLMVFVIAQMAVFSCGKNGNSVYGPSDSNPITTTMTGTYRISGDSIYVTASYPADTSSYCFGDSLILRIDSAQPPQESGIPYSITNNTLTIIEPYNTTSMSGYGVSILVNFTRVGQGVGVQGTWNGTSMGYQVLYGTLPDSVRNELDLMVAQANQSLASGEISMQFTFSGNQITAVQSYTPDWADNYVSSWTDCNLYGTDTCSYAVTVVKLNSATVQLHGKTSGETVTITWKANGDQHFTSSDTSHHAYTYYENPVTCPNNFEPDWFFNFLTANAKAVPYLNKKSLQRMTVPKNPLLKKLLRLF